MFKLHLVFGLVTLTVQFTTSQDMKDVTEDLRIGQQFIAQQSVFRKDQQKRENLVLFTWQKIDFCTKQNPHGARLWGRNATFSEQLEAVLKMLIDFKVLDQASADLIPRDEQTLKQHDSLEAIPDGMKVWKDVLRLGYFFQDILLEQAHQSKSSNPIEMCKPVQAFIGSVHLKKDYKYMWKQFVTFARNKEIIEAGRRVITANFDKTRTKFISSRASFELFLRNLLYSLVHWRTKHSKLETLIVAKRTIDYLKWIKLWPAEGAFAKEGNASDFKAEDVKVIIDWAYKEQPKGDHHHCDEEMLKKAYFPKEAIEADSLMQDLLSMMELTESASDPTLMETTFKSVIEYINIDLQKKLFMLISVNDLVKMGLSQALISAVEHSFDREMKWHGQCKDDCDSKSGCFEYAKKPFQWMKKHPTTTIVSVLVAGGLGVLVNYVILPLFDTTNVSTDNPWTSPLSIITNITDAIIPSTTDKPINSTVLMWIIINSALIAVIVLVLLWLYFIQRMQRTGDSRSVEENPTTTAIRARPVNSPTTQGPASQRASGSSGTQGMSSSASSTK